MNVIPVFGIIIIISLAIVVLSHQRVSYNQGPEDYIACGCGCCPGLEPREECVPEGKTLQGIMAEDRVARESPVCEAVGCSYPIEYAICS